MNPTKQILLAMAIVPLVALAAGNMGDHRDGHGRTASQNAGKPGDPASVTRTVKVVMHDKCVSHLTRSRSRPVIPCASLSGIPARWNTRWSSGPAAS